MAQFFPEIAFDLTAWRTDEVGGVLAQAQRCTAEGWWAYGFVSYEAAPGLDSALTVRDPVDGLPLAWFGVCAAPIDVPVVAPVDGRAYAVGPWQCDWSRHDHRERITTIRSRIADGDTYQCNLTTRLRAPVRGDPRQLYADLALAQRGAYNAYLDLGRFVIASASPELFFEIRDGRLHMRPMKGTAPRGRTAAEDAVISERLQSSDKERAENIMIVDLIRNDLAQVATTSSMTVSSLCRPERYETVHQLTSDVSAELRPEIDLVDIFRSLFPCGSVTGAPKRSTMQLIREIEDSPRGVYCGAVGVLAPPDAPVRARFNVAIRTVVIDRDSETAVYGTGGGVTWSSTSDAEYDELLCKAKLLDSIPVDFHLIETLRHEAHRGLIGLDAHLRRITASASYFGFEFDPAAARRTLSTHVSGVGDARVRLMAFRDGALIVEVDDLPPNDRRPVFLAIDDHPIDSRQCWPHHKTSLRGPYIRALQRHPHADEVVLTNERGEATECTSANLAVQLDDRWWTPPLGGGCLPGVERGRLIDAGVLAERVLTPADLPRADALAVVSSLRGWRQAQLFPLEPSSPAFTSTSSPAAANSTNECKLKAAGPDKVDRLPIRAEECPDLGNSV